MSERTSENLQLLRKLVFVAVLMFAFGYALVPIYKKICEVTGVYDLTKPDEVVNTQIDETRSITMEFDANVRSDIGWIWLRLIKGWLYILVSWSKRHFGSQIQLTFLSMHRLSRVMVLKELGCT